ncbi:MAG: xanthine dehydrogenase family protein molybdopterin-binding subunit [Actinobacteria bacterium]|nr:xanthine dehydrogenase family protein molybdopterin-binding subunit [Actinomycetota bacterium]
MKAVGARLPRYDGLQHVTGQSVYVDDVRVPDMLWAKALRSTVHSAEIKKLDVSKALRVPGVHAVVTHEDVPVNIVGHLAALGVPADEPLLAEHEVRYQGQPIAVVAAETEEIAQEAVNAIEISYEEREPFLDIRKAFDPDVPKVSPSGNLFVYEPYTERRVRKGDIDWAFEKADRIVQGVYRPAAIEHCPTETQVALVVPEATGRLVIYSCTQAMYFSMGVVATHLGVSLNDLKFVGGTVGGGFGGKVDTAAETISALLAIKAKRPVKWRWTREEEFLCSSVRATWHVEIADAVTKDGWILGRRTLTLHDAGAYTRFSSYGATKHAFHLGGAYTIPNLSFNAYVIWSNHVPTTAMRGFGVTSVSFAVELHMTRIATVLGIDPWELRLKNASRVGDTAPTRVVLKDPSAVPTIQAAAQAAGVELASEYRAMTNAPRKGKTLPRHLVDQLGAWRDNGGR